MSKDIWKLGSPFQAALLEKVKMEAHPDDEKDMRVSLPFHWGDGDHYVIAVALSGDTPRLTDQSTTVGWWKQGDMDAADAFFTAEGRAKLKQIALEGGCEYAAHNDGEFTCEIAATYESPAHVFAKGVVDAAFSLAQVMARAAQSMDDSDERRLARKRK